MKVTFVWFDKKDIPIKELSLLVMTENKKLMTLKDSIGFYNGDKSTAYSDWDNIVKKYKIKYWIYQSALIDNENWNGYWND